MNQLIEMPNIGKELARQLTQVGIETPEALCKIGSCDAWLRIRDFEGSACINRLYALEGAIQGIRWHNLPPDVKKSLRDFYNLP